MSTLQYIFAAAQTTPIPGDIQANVAAHVALIQQAATEGVELVVFPELSLTGYEPQLAQSLAFEACDPRLDPLREESRRHRMTIVVGAPVRSSADLHIASFILRPDREPEIYTKLYLHPGEDAVFCPYDLNPLIHEGQQTAALAICADMSDSRHPARAASQGATIYLVSAFITPRGYSSDIKTLSDYARRHHMAVLMANFGAPSGGHDAAGGSVLISAQGGIVGRLPDSGEGLLVATGAREGWTDSRELLSRIEPVPESAPGCHTTGSKIELVRPEVDPT